MLAHLMFVRDPKDEEVGVRAKTKLQAVRRKSWPKRDKSGKSSVIS